MCGGEALEKAQASRLLWERKRSSVGALLLLLHLLVVVRNHEAEARAHRAERDDARRVLVVVELHRHHNVLRGGARAAGFV